MLTYCAEVVGSETTTASKVRATVAAVVSLKRLANSMALSLVVRGWMQSGW